MRKLESPQAIRTIFFDAGFTLLRTSPSLVEICQDVCRREGVRLDIEQIAQQLPAAEAYFAKAIKSNGRTWASEEAIILFWDGYYKALLRPCIEGDNEALLERCAQEIIKTFDLHTSWELYPDVLPTLQGLQGRGFTLGIISDWGGSLASIIAGLDLPRYFDCLTISAVTRHAKPEPGLYELALRRAGGISDYAIHIGDSYILDVLGARAVGITPILIDRPGHLRAQEMDCLVIHDLREVLDLLDISTAPAVHAATPEQQHYQGDRLES
ncbi:MAG TPA: HAD-IA family hydrolase [Ktedonobacterales bacterium]|nr:HAD-IA family hydrolase [Ktedonobacterales bacterium]